MVQVGEYTIHGWYGIYYFKFPNLLLHPSHPVFKHLARGPCSAPKDVRQADVTDMSFSGRGLASFQRSGNPSKRCRTGYVKFSNLPDRGIPGLFEQRGGEGYLNQDIWQLMADYLWLVGSRFTVYTPKISCYFNTDMVGRWLEYFFSDNTVYIAGAFIFSIEKVDV